MRGRQRPVVAGTSPRRGPATSRPLPWRGRERRATRGSHAASNVQSGRNQYLVAHPWFITRPWLNLGTTVGRGDSNCIDFLCLDNRIALTLTLVRPPVRAVRAWDATTL